MIIVKGCVTTDNHEMAVKHNKISSPWLYVEFGPKLY